jgi:hypothetical protein
VKIAAQPKATVRVGVVSPHTTLASFSVSSIQSGTTDTLELVVKDAAGNAITGLTKASLALTLLNGTSKGTFGGLIATSTPGIYTMAFTGSIAGTATTVNLAIGGVQLSSQPTVQVTPGAVSSIKSSASFETSSVLAGGTDTLTIQAKDAAGNAITGLIDTQFILSLSGSSVGKFGTVTETTTPGTYTASFTGESAGKPSILGIEIGSIVLIKKPIVTVVA